MDSATVLWILVPLAALHAAVARSRSALAFQLLLDLALLALPLRPLMMGAHLGPGVADAQGWGAPVTIVGSPEQTDLPLEFYVWWEEIRRLAAAGEPPWVSDRLGAGTPLYTNGQTGLPFPLNLPVWVLGPERGSDVMAVWKLELAALGCFLLLRRVGVHAAAAAMGALAYSCGFYLLSWLVVPLAWLVAATPWAFRALIGTLWGRRIEGALLAVLMGALAGWSVHPESAAFLFLALAVAGLVLAWRRPRRLARLAASIVLAVAVAGVGAVPTLLSIGESAKLAAARSHPLYPMPWVDNPLRARLAALLLVPWREGHPADGSWRRPFVSSAVAVGVGAAPLAVLLAAVPRRRHRRLALAVAVCGSGAALLLWQVPGVAHLFGRLPPLSWMVWARGAFLLAFALAVLAAVGADAWLRRPRRMRLFTAGLGVQIVVFWLIATAPGTTPRVHLWLPAWAPGAVALLALVPPAGVGWLLAGVVLAEMVLAGAALVPASATGAAMAGVCTELQRRVGAEDGRVLALHGALPANLGARLGVEDLRSYDPMRPRTLAFLHHALGSEGLDLPGPIMRPWAAIAGAWGVRWLVTPPSGVGCARWAAGWEEVYRDDSGALYRNRRALPILRLATTAVTPPGEAAEGDWEGLDFATTAVMDQPLRLGGSGEIALLERRPWRVVAHVRAAGPVLAVLHVPRTSGWGVRIDGRPAPLLTANLAALAVVVPDGAHEIRFSYAPAGLLSGTVLTAVGLAGCALLARRREWR